MVAKSVHLRLNAELYKQIKILEQSLGFSNIQEFIKDAVRHTIEEYKDRVIIKRLKALQGNAKSKKNLLSRKKAFEEYLKKDPSEILRKFNL